MHTFGHGTLTAGAFLALLAKAGIHGNDDIRSFPEGRRNPQYGRQEMEPRVPEAGSATSGSVSSEGGARP